MGWHPWILGEQKVLAPDLRILWTRTGSLTLRSGDLSLLPPSSARSRLSSRRFRGRRGAGEERRTCARSGGRSRAGTAAGGGRAGCGGGGRGSGESAPPSPGPQPPPPPQPHLWGPPGLVGAGRCRGAPISRRGVGVLRLSLAAPGEGQVALEGGGGGRRVGPETPGCTPASPADPLGVGDRLSTPRPLRTWDSEAALGPRLHSCPLRCFGTPASPNPPTCKKIPSLCSRERHEGLQLPVAPAAPGL